MNAELEVRASILIAIESIAGDWCTVAWLADHVIASQIEVGAICQDLASSGLVMTRTFYVEPIYGVRIVGDYPCVLDYHGGRLEVAMLEDGWKLNQA